MIWASVLKSSASNETASTPSTSTPEYTSTHEYKPSTPEYKPSTPKYKPSGSRVHVPKVTWTGMSTAEYYTV